MYHKHVHILETRVKVRVQIKDTGVVHQVARGAPSHGSLWNWSAAWLNTSFPQNLVTGVITTIDLIDKDVSFSQETSPNSLIYHSLLISRFPLLKLKLPYDLSPLFGSERARRGDNLGSTM